MTVEYLKSKIPNLLCVKYFSDGCAAQYKKKKISIICAITMMVLVCKHLVLFLPPRHGKFSCGNTE